MKKWNNYFVKAVLLLLVAAPAIGQSETFDIITYTAPKDPAGTGWKKDAKPGVVNYVHVNSTSGGFCVITLYASTASDGDAATDFANAWKELVVDPYQVGADPQTEKQTTTEGWEIVAAAAPAKVDGADVYIILTVLSGFGKKVCIRTSLNDQSYMPQLESFLGSIDLDKTKPAPVTTTNTSTNSGGGKFGSLIYTPPAGWSHQVFQDGVVFKPLDLPADEHLAIQIMQPINFSGSIEQALAKSYNEAAAMYNATTMNYAGTGMAYQKTDAKRSFQGWEYIRANGGVMVENGTPYKSELGLDIFIIKINDRFERIAILQSRKNCSYSRYYAAERVKYYDAINHFLFHIRFADGESPLLKPGTVNGSGITGVWQGISMSTTANSGLQYKVFSPIFLTNGQAYFGPKFPGSGLDALDTRIPAELYRRDWGTYTFSNGRGVLRMPYGDIPMRMEGNKLIITPNQTDHKFYQLPSVDGARFNGTYALTAENGKIPMIVFTSDGRFNDNGAIKVLYHEYVDCLNPALTPGSGTYEVRDFSITFNYTDGRKVKIAFLGTEYDKSNPSPAILRMSSNEDPMARQ